MRAQSTIATLTNMPITAAHAINPPMNRTMLTSLVSWAAIARNYHPFVVS